nr:adenosine 5'-monophosphoramidase HINT3-like [Lytechinus pictus]
MSMSMNEVESRLRNDFLSTIEDPHFKDGCIFCKIAQGKEPNTKILFQNEAACVFHDIRPSTKEHLLIIPKSHHGNVKSLEKCKIPLVQYLYQVGEVVLESRGGNIADARVGFHWPPFNTIDHLHLHVVYPVNEMSFLGKVVNRPNSFWFVTYEWALNYLEKKKDSPDESQTEIPVRETQGKL